MTVWSFALVSSCVGLSMRVGPAAFGEFHGKAVSSWHGRAGMCLSAEPCAATGLKLILIRDA